MPDTPTPDDLMAEGYADPEVQAANREWMDAPLGECPHGHGVTPNGVPYSGHFAQDDETRTAVEQIVDAAAKRLSTPTPDEVEAYSVGYDEGNGDESCFTLFHDGKQQVCAYGETARLLYDTFMVAENCKRSTRIGDLERALEHYTSIGTPEEFAALKREHARIYPCDECGKLRSKAEGGTVFSVCDECWDKAHPSHDAAQAIIEGSEK